jgi:hypothetical protein
MPNSEFLKRWAVPVKHKEFTGEFFCPCGCGLVCREVRCVHCDKVMPPGESDYYMVLHPIWSKATHGKERDGQMHWDCLTIRLAGLGHTLTFADLMALPMNEAFKREKLEHHPTIM